jgi:predicted ArsR family transcriptional regulator
MQADRFFDSTRGRIVAELRGRRGVSAHDIAASFGLSPNAIRQQLTILERDGLVVGHAVRRGKTKPTIEFALTTAGEQLFPQRYDKMLNSVLREVRTIGGDAMVAQVFEGMGKRSAAKLNAKIAGASGTQERAEALVAQLREQGVEAEFVRVGDGFAIREHTCPYANTVGEHPEVCNVIHTILKEVVPGESRHVESLATGGTECRFELEEEPRTAAAS